MVRGVGQRMLSVIRVFDHPNLKRTMLLSPLVKWI